MIFSIHDGARSWILSFHLSLVIAVTFSCVRIVAADENPKSVYATIQYNPTVEFYATGDASSPSGFVVTTLPTDNVGKTRVSVTTSMPADGFDISEFRLVAVTKSGKTFELTRGSSSMGNGRQFVTMVLMAEFPTFGKNIETLVIQRQKPNQVGAAPPNAVGAVARKGEKPGQITTAWGAIADLDGDCEISATDDRLTMNIPGRSHDLSPLAGNNAPSALNRVGGNFTFQVKVTGEFQPGPKSQSRGAPFNGAGILVWENERNYLRIERNAYWISETKLVCHMPLIEYWSQYRERGANTRQVSADTFPGKSTWLKVERQGKKLTVSVSHDKQDWNEIKTVSCDFSDDVFVGVAAVNTSTAPFAVEFSEFQLTADRRPQNELAAKTPARPTAIVGDFMMDISNQQVSNAELYRVCNDSELTILKAAYSSITNDGLKEVARAKKLKSLDLSETQVTEAGIKELAGLKNLYRLELSGLAVTDLGAKELGNMAELRSIGLRNTKVTDAGLVDLIQLKKLTSLDLAGTAVTDAGLIEIGKHPQITELGLGSTKITDAGLTHLAFQKDLSKLDLSETSVTNIGLKSLAGLKRLKELNLRKTSVTDEGLLELAGFDTLSTLDLSQTEITDQGLGNLPANSLLSTLELANLPITDLGIKFLTGQKRLTVLNLDGTSVTDAGLKDVATLSQLRKLFVRKNHLSESALDTLQASLPKCEIHRE